MEYSKIPIIGWLFGWMEAEDVNYGPLVIILGVILVFFALHMMNLSEVKVLTFLFASAPIWLPSITFQVFFAKYMEAVGKKFDHSTGRAFLEIVLPPEVFKTPEAMEFVIDQLFNKASPDNLMQTYIDGKRPPIYSFELVSRGGDVRFYATLPPKNINSFTDAMYSQYPGVEIKKLDLDYTAEVPSDLKGWAMMSFQLSKKKDSEIPIKTYVEFGLDKPQKDEEKVDPMTPMLEVLSGIKPHQQVWIQFLFKAHREQNFKMGQLGSKDTWEDGVYKKINEMMQRDPKTKSGPEELEGMPRLTTGERDLIEAMERNVGKTAYEFACRFVYLSKDPTDFDGGLFGRVLRSFATTEIVKRNGIGIRWRTDFNYKLLSDPFGKIIPALKKQELKEYKSRILFPKSGAMSWKILTTEELATIFHLPGKVAVTPTLNRVQSTRGEAPTNLPIARS